jgi:hypothetical protein
VAQGFYFSEPLRAGQFDELLARHFAAAQRRAAGLAAPHPAGMTAGAGR